MNLVEGTLESANSASVETGRIPIGVAPSSPAGAQLTLGVRPEHVHIGGTDLTATVVSVEMLGHERHVICQVGGSRWVIRQSSDAAHLESGASIGLGIDAHEVHAFDTATTERVN